MEKEIKVRKKRFAAFWVAVLVVCGMVLPMVASASDYTITVSQANEISGLQSGNILYENDTILYTSEIEAEFPVTYYNHKNEEVVDAINVSYNQKHTVNSYISLPENATFQGWYVDTVSASSGVLTAVTLFAQISYPITYFGVENATHSNPPQYTYGKEVTLTDASRPGYTFEGWFTDQTYETKITGIADNTEGALTLYAKFTPMTYSITYEHNGGTHENTVLSYTYGVGIDSFAPATKEGYTFEGWYSDANFTTKMESIGTDMTDDVTLYAKFTRSIQYELNDGTNAASNPTSYVEGVGATLSAASKPGFVFDGWYTDGGFTTKIESIGTEITGDLKLHAKFVIGAIGPYTYDLKAGVQYQLGSVTKVSGDSSVYASGSTFYVPEDGSYTFS